MTVVGQSERRTVESVELVLRDFRCFAGEQQSDVNPNVRYDW